jgi:hypothetical protein
MLEFEFGQHLQEGDISDGQEAISSGADYWQAA